MVLSRRERYILILTGLVLGLLIGDRYVLTPLLDHCAELAAERDKLQAQVNRAEGVLARAEQVAPAWKKRSEAGLKADPAGAESQILHAVRDWAAEAGLDLALLKPDRSADKTPLPAIAFQATANGSMNAVARFVWRLEHAEIPLRVTELQLGSRKEGTDNLSVQLRLSTVYLPKEAPAVARAASQPVAEGVAE